MMVIILVALVGAIAYTLWANDRATKRLNEMGARVIAEAEKGAQRYAEGYQMGVDDASKTLGTATVSVVENVAKVMMNEMVGRPEEVKLPPAVDGTMQPEWITWEVEDTGPEDFGVGDSVVIDREYDSRVAAIADGESIIPGVALPDMSGEKFDG